MTINYQVNYNGYASDVDDLFIRKDVFSTGGLWVWGSNSGNSLGLNNTSDYSSPVQTVAGGTNWKQVSCGYEGWRAIKTDGTLWQSGSIPTIFSSDTNWKQVSLNYADFAAIKTDGTLWNWGNNFYGQLGDNTVSHQQE